MCLYIDLTFHKASKKPAVATRDILVWIVLKYSDKLGGVAPYRGCRWDFGSKRETTTLSRDDFPCKNIIEYGLHATLSQTSARKLASSFYNGYGSNPAKVFPAIIPKGSKLFFGSYRDIVATRMIVYKDLAAVEAKHGPIAPKVPKKLLVS